MGCAGELISGQGDESVGGWTDSEEQTSWQVPEQKGHVCGRSTKGLEVDGDALGGRCRDQLAWKGLTSIPAIPACC